MLIDAVRKTKKAIYSTMTRLTTFIVPKFVIVKLYLMNLEFKGNLL